MHLLDTDTLTHLHQRSGRVAERLADLADPDVGTTIVTRLEILRGRSEYLLKAATGADVMRAQELLQQSEQLLDQMLIVPVSATAAMRFNELQQVRGLRKIGHNDLLIASIALSHNAVLVTRNLRHFRQVPDLSLVNWVD